MATIGRLIVMLAADAVGYSSLIGADEEGTLARLEAHRHQLVYPKIEEHCGRIVRATGGSLLVEFASPTEAVRCAVELQRGMIDRNIGTAPDRRITFRVGVDIGELTANGDNLVSRAVAALPIDELATLIKPGTESYGGADNITVRVAALADPGGICISGTVRDVIRDQLPYTFKGIGKHNLGIGATPVHCYAMSAHSVASRQRAVAQDQRASTTRRGALRRAALAASVAATVSVWAVALWAWLGANSSPVPIPAPVAADSQDSRMRSVSSVADGDAHERSAPRSPLVSNRAADSDTRAPWALQPPLASNTDRSTRAPSLQPTVSDIGAAVVRGKQASALKTTPESDTAVVRGAQAPSALKTTPESDTAVVRGAQAPSALRTTPDSGTAIVRGNQAPSTRETPPDAGTDVVRGTRAPSGPSFSIVALPFEHPPSTHPDQE